MYLTEQEQQEINGLVAEVEAASGAQLMVAVIGKADAYPEIPWKAFALGAALASMFVAAAAVSHYAWTGSIAIYTALTMVCGAGLACALATIFLPVWGRLFLDRTRSAVEVRQAAQAMFLARGMFATRARVGILLLLSLYERQAAIVADAGIAQHLPETELEAISTHVAALLALGEACAAAQAGLRAIEQRLRGKLERAGAPDEIATAVVQERGA